MVSGGGANVSGGLCLRVDWWSFLEPKVSVMGRFSFSATWIIGAVVAVACSSSEKSNDLPSLASGSTTSGAGLATGHSGGSSSIDLTTGGSAGSTSTTNGGSSSGEGATTGTGLTTGTETGGATDGAGGESTASTGGDGTSDPGPDAGVGGGETTDPPPGDTGDPPPGDTGDPPPGDTGDPPPGDTGDPPPGDTGDPPPGDTGDPPPGDTGDPPPGDTGDPPDECIPTEMDNLNVIVFKDAEPSGADSEGRMFVGGNAIFDGYAIASQEDADCSRWDLVVGGDLTVSGGSVSNGKIAVGGTYNPVGAFTAACGVWEDTTPVDFVALRAEMLAYSEAMAAYPENGDSVVSNGALMLTGTDPTLNVFSVTAAELNNSLQLSVPEGSSVIVNVSGEDVVWSGQGFLLPDGGAACRGATSDWCHSIMYNMYEATSLELSGIGVQGSIMAPYATFTGNGGNVDGQVIVEYLYGGIEFHPYFFTGCLLLPEVPA